MRPEVYLLVISTTSIKERGSIGPRDPKWDVGVSGTRHPSGQKTEPQVLKMEGGEREKTISEEWECQILAWVPWHFGTKFLLSGREIKIQGQLPTWV